MHLTAVRRELELLSAACGVVGFSPTSWPAGLNNIASCLLVTFSGNPGQTPTPRQDSCVPCFGDRRSHNRQLLNVPWRSQALLWSKQGCARDNRPSTHATAVAIIMPVTGHTPARQ